MGVHSPNIVCIYIYYYYYKYIYIYIIINIYIYIIIDVAPPFEEMRTKRRQNNPWCHTSSKAANLGRPEPSSAWPNTLTALRADRLLSLLEPFDVRSLHSAAK